MLLFNSQNRHTSIHNLETLRETFLVSLYVYFDSNWIRVKQLLTVHGTIETLKLIEDSLRQL